MFSKELENLIQATLEDGILDDYEKAALVKRAAAEGVDLAELEIYINSILQRRKRELAKEQDAKQEILDQKKKEDFGRTCPNCGKQVPPLTLVCDCGYEFTRKKEVSSVQLLFEKINNIQPTKAEIDSASKTGDGLEDLKRKKKLDIIQTFPVPNTKEDIIEFLALSLSNAKTKGGLLGTRKGRILIVLAFIIIVVCITGILGSVGIISVESEVEDGISPIAWIIVSEVFFGGIIGSLFVRDFDEETLHHNDAAVVWKAKFNQVLLKGRSLRADSEFTQQLDYYENMLNKK